MLSRTITLAVLLLASTLFAKPTYLPPLKLKSKASNDVHMFLNKEKQSTDIKIQKSSARDILGRIKKSSNNNKNELYYVLRPQRTLDVYISPMQESREIQPISGRFEINGSGEKKYWLDENRITEEDYFRKVESKQEEFIPVQQYNASLIASEIETLLNGPEPIFIDIARKPIFDDYTLYTTIFGYSEIASHAHADGYKGQDIGVFFNDGGCSNPIGYNSGYYVLLNTCSDVLMHPTAVAKTISATAPLATLYAYDGLGTGFLSSLNMNAHNPTIEISSHSWHYLTNGVYSAYDKNMDNYIYNNRLISFYAAGNISSNDTTSFVGSPGLALNTIAVGAINPTNNNYASYSKWKNSNVRNQKPEMANYSEFYFPNINIDVWNGYFAGTSASTPYTAGIFADLLSQYSFFKRHPELIKALIVSGEKIPIGNASSYDLDNNSIAAKGIIRYSSIAWNHRFRYWSGSNSCCFDNNNKITFTETGIVPNTHYRIAIAWLTNGDYVILNNSISQDIDLRVYQNGTLLKSSISAQNPFEVVDFTTTSNADLTIEIYRYANSGSDNVILGYTLWNDF
ncbi:MAG: S8 family serine peptidase [Fibrobacter sp.]|jgi:hypothetical protein|nr:S8 family serine peptidase [Fibrobacter sp.]